MIVVFVFPKTEGILNLADGVSTEGMDFSPFVDFRTAPPDSIQGRAFWQFILCLVGRPPGHGLLGHWLWRKPCVPPSVPSVPFKRPKSSMSPKLKPEKITSPDIEYPDISRRRPPQYQIMYLSIGVTTNGKPSCCPPNC